jgi:hypothetical protein
MQKKLTARVLTGAAIVSAAAGLLLGVMPSDAVPARTAAAPASAATATGAATATAHAKPALKPASLQFSSRCWGRGNHCTVMVHAPKGWKFSQLSLQQAKFTDSSNTWMLRVDGGLGGKVSTSRAAQQRVKALYGVPGLKTVSVTHGTTASKVGWDAPRVAYSAVTYTYRDGARGQRWVSTRFVDTYENGRRAYIEITVAGRPQDRAGLNKVLTEATQRVALVG